MYQPKGFTLEYLLYKEFIKNTLAKHDTIEDYLNKVKVLSNNLNNQELELPKQVIYAWVLNGLTPIYEGFVAIVTQGFRNDPSSINTDDLFSNLLDESRRQVALETETALYLKYINKPHGYSKQPARDKLVGIRKKPKGKYYKNYKKPNFKIKDYYFLFPNKAPEGFKLKTQIRRKRRMRRTRSP
jgi:gag-polypeptide of LTR copia-type